MDNRTFIAISLMVVMLVAGIGIGLYWGTVMTVGWENMTQTCCACPNISFNLKP